MNSKVIRLSDDIISGILTMCENRPVDLRQQTRQQSNIRKKRMVFQKRESLTVSLDASLLAELKAIVSVKRLTKVSVIRMLVEGYVRDNRWVLSGKRKD